MFHNFATNMQDAYFLVKIWSKIGFFRSPPPNYHPLAVRVINHRRRQPALEYFSTQLPMSRYLLFHFVITSPSSFLPPHYTTVHILFCIYTFTCLEMAFSTYTLVEKICPSTLLKNPVETMFKKCRHNQRGLQFSAYKAPLPACLVPTN